MKRIICAALLALTAPLMALPVTAQLEDTTNAQVALPLPLANSNAYAFRLEEADQQAKNVLHHDLSGLVCPYIIDNHALTKITQFSHSGHDVACGYNSQEANSYITFYMSRYGEDATPEVMMEQAALQLEAAYTVVEAGETNPVELNFGEELLQCQQRQYKIMVDITQRNSGIWTCNIDGWALKVRATWIGDDIIPLAGIDSFSSRQKTASETLTACASQRTDFEALETASAPEENIDAIFAYALAKPQASSLEQPLCFLNKFNNRERALVLGWLPSAETPLFFAHQYDSFGPIEGTRIELMPAPGIAAIVINGLNDASETLWHIIAYSEPNTAYLIKEYTDQPTTEQFIADVLAISSGDVSPIGGVTLGENGKTEIIISDTALGDDEEADEPVED